MNGTILGMTKREIDRKFDEIVDFSGVEQFLDTPIKRYSSGMQVRLAFSVAAHLEPEILIVDEVLAVGDQAFQQKCMGRMQNISQLGRTVLFVSHNMSAIQNLCQRVVMLDAGRVSYIGAADAGIKFYVDGVGQEDDAEIELARHPSRRTNCRPLLQRLRLLQHSGEATSRFKCGEPIILELSLDAAPELADIHCWIQVHDELGTRLFTVSTELSDTAPLGLKMPMQALCRIDELPLTPGSYFLTLLAGPIGERAPPTRSTEQHASESWKQITTAMVGGLIVVEVTFLCARRGVRETPFCGDLQNGSQNFQFASQMTLGERRCISGNLTCLSSERQRQAPQHSIRTYRLIQTSLCAILRNRPST